MNEEFMVIVTVKFDGNFREWHGGTFNHYPTNEEIKASIVGLKEKHKYSEYSLSILYARVEKRYSLVD
jgi:hypothetical protein